MEVRTTARSRQPAASVAPSVVTRLRALRRYLVAPRGVTVTPACHGVGRFPGMNPATATRATRLLKEGGPRKAGSGAPGDWVLIRGCRGRRISLIMTGRLCQITAPGWFGIGGESQRSKVAGSLGTSHWALKRSSWSSTIEEA